MLVTDATEKKNVLSDTRFSNVAAVKNNAVYVVPRIAHVWGNRTTEQPLTILWTINKLYPQLEAKDALAKDISYFYSHFFKTNFTDDQINEIIG